MAMTADLSAEEQRVLGCLIEKGATTPETYPLTMNALVAACSQTSNRDPIVAYDEATVSATLTSLREQKLIRIVYPAHARVTKYRHCVDEAWALAPGELAVVAVLLLRGPQTVNELTIRTERYGGVDDLGGAAGVLDRLAGRPEPMVTLAERRSGQREDRWVHLLGTVPVASPKEEKSERTGSLAQRVETLEEQTATLRAVVAELQAQLEDLVGGPIPPREPQAG